MGICLSAMDQEEMEKRTEKKRLAMEVLSAEAKAAQLLSEMPGRVCSNGATKTCCLHTRQGCKGVNQDSMLVWEGFAAEEDSIFCGVFDGHGPNGHLVASKVRDCLPSLLTLPLETLLQRCDHANLAKPGATTTDRNNDQGAKDEDNQNNLVDAHGGDHVDSAWMHERFTAAFHKMDERLKTHPKLSCMSSGTTAVAILVQGKDLVVASVGDSRAILGRRDENGTLIAHQLTVDLKPDSPGELERIEECQGRVFALEDEPHIARLWLPNADTPGLAMARAFGDFCLKDHGLIATPHVTHQRLTLQDEVIVLATDGVWDVLSNDDVINVISSCSSNEEAAKNIAEVAVKAWKKRNLSSRIDDIAIVCHFLHNKLNPFSTSKISKKMKLSGSKDNVEHADLSVVSLDEKHSRQLFHYDTIVGIDTIDMPNST